MKLDIEALNFPLSSARRRYIQSAVSLALGVNRKRTDLAEIRLSEFRADDGELYQRCLVWVELDCGELLVSESSDAELCFAVDRAADQVSWEVDRFVRFGAPDDDVDLAASASGYRPASTNDMRLDAA